MKINLKFIFLFSSFFFICFQKSNPLIVKNDSNTLKLAFGSCNKFLWDDDSDILYSIKNYQPDLFIWLGKKKLILILK